MRYLCILLSLLWLCRCTVVVKPQYIDPELDIRDTYLKGLKDYQKKPLASKVPSLLKTGETYVRRMDYKVQKNNTRALQ